MKNAWFVLAVGLGVPVPGAAPPASPSPAVSANEVSGITAFLVARALDRATGVPKKDRPLVGEATKSCRGAEKKKDVSFGVDGVQCFYFRQGFGPGVFRCTIEQAGKKAVELRGDPAIDLAAALHLAGVEGEAASGGSWIPTGRITCTGKFYPNNGGGGRECGWVGTCSIEPP